MRDPDAPAVVHILDEPPSVEEFDTLRDAVRFLTTQIPAHRRQKAWIATTLGPQIEMDELALLAADLGIEWDPTF